MTIRIFGFGKKNAEIKQMEQKPAQQTLVEAKIELSQRQLITNRTNELIQKFTSHFGAREGKKFADALNFELKSQELSEGACKAVPVYRTNRHGDIVTDWTPSGKRIKPVEHYDFEPYTDAERETINLARSETLLLKAEKGVCKALNSRDAPDIDSILTGTKQYQTRQMHS